MLMGWCEMVGGEGVSFLETVWRSPNSWGELTRIDHQQLAANPACRLTA